MFEDDEHFDTFTFDFVWLTNSSGLSHRWMANQTRLNLHRTQAVTADFDDVVYATLDAEVAVFVFGSSITGEVDIGDGLQIGAVTIGIFVDGAHLAGPGMANDQEATFVRANGHAIFIDHISFDGWQRP